MSERLWFVALFGAAMVFSGVFLVVELVTFLLAPPVMRWERRLHALTRELWRALRT